MPYTNLSYLKDFTGNDPDLMKDAIQRYLKKSPGLLKELNDGFENEDWEKVSFSAHTLFGATQIVGIEDIKNNLRVAEKAKENPDAEELKKNIEAINLAMEASFQELKEYI